MLNLARRAKKQLWILSALIAGYHGNVYMWAPSRAKAMWEESQVVPTAVSMTYVMNHKLSLTNESWNNNASTQGYDTCRKRCPSRFFPKTVLIYAIDSIHEENNIIYICWLENSHTSKDSDQRNGYKEECYVKDQVLICMNTSSTLLFQVPSLISDSAITLWPSQQILPQKQPQWAGV